MTDNPLDLEWNYNSVAFYWPKIGNCLNKPGFATGTTKTGACLECDPAQNQSGFMVTCQHIKVMIIKYKGDMHVQMFFVQN